MSNIHDAVLKFKDRTGGNGFPASVLLYRLASVSMNVEKNDGLISHNLLKQRLDFVKTEADTFFENENIVPMNPEPLDNGGESMIIDCNNDYVLKIRRGETYPQKQVDFILQPVKSGYSQQLDINYDIFPKVDCEKNVPTTGVIGLMFRAAKAGMFLHDPTKHNFGFISDAKNNEGQKKEKMVVVDYGAVSEGSSSYATNIAYALYLTARTVATPVYTKMPFIHPYWQQFRSNMMLLLGYKPRDNPALQGQQIGPV